MEREENDATVAETCTRNEWSQAMATVRFVPSCPALVDAYRRDEKREGPRWSWES